MKNKRGERKQNMDLKLAERPDPFKAPKSYYQDRTSYVPDGNHCGQCWKHANRHPVPAAADHDLLKKWADWKYPSRDDMCNRPFKRKKNDDLNSTFTFSCPRRTILDNGHPDPTESRFDTAPCSSFLAGEVHEQQSSYNNRLRSTMGGTAGKFFTTRSSFGNTKVSRFNSSMLMTPVEKRPNVANLANVPSVKIANYSKRNSDKLFHRQGEAPQPCDSEGHGGLFYDTSKHGKFAWSSKLSNTVPFERKVENKKEKMDRIESITRKLKSSDKSSKKSQAMEVARENAELLFDLLHGSKSVRKSTTNRESSRKLNHGIMM